MITMTVTVKLIAGLDDALGLKGNEIQYDEVRDVEDILDKLCKEDHGNEKEIYENVEEKVISDRLMILLNGRNIVHLDGKDSEVSDGDKVTMFPPVAGG